MIKKEIAVPVIEISSKGRRPYLSDMRPIIGVAMNWQIENMENNKPFWKSVNPKRFEYP